MVFGLHKTTHFADISIYPTKNQIALNLRTIVEIGIGLMPKNKLKWLIVVVSAVQVN